METSQSAELEEIAEILACAEGMRAVYEQMLEDVSGGKKASGAEGVTADQMVDFGLVRMRFGVTYCQLSELTADSLSVRQFLDVAPGTPIFSKIGVPGQKLLNK